MAIKIRPTNSNSIMPVSGVVVGAIIVAAAVMTFLNIAAIGFIGL